MADAADVAQQDAEQVELLGLHRRALTRGPAPKGVCYNCDEAVPEKATFCDADCQHDWLNRTRSRQQQAW